MSTPKDEGEAYKVVTARDGRYFSAVEHLPETVVEYYTHRMVGPTMPGTPLLVFAHPDAAIEFAKVEWVFDRPLQVWGVRTNGTLTPVRTLCSQSRARFQLFWKGYKAGLHETSSFYAPYGTHALWGECQLEQLLWRSHL